jgi:FtsZ-interacting cell division protein ZipA
MRLDIIVIIIVIVIFLFLCWIISRNKKVVKTKVEVKVLEENKPDIRVREKRFYDTLTYDFQ